MILQDPYGTPSLAVRQSGKGDELTVTPTPGDDPYTTEISNFIDAVSVLQLWADVDRRRTAPRDSVHVRGRSEELRVHVGGPPRERGDDQAPPCGGEVSEWIPTMNRENNRMHSLRSTNFPVHVASWPSPRSPHLAIPSPTGPRATQRNSMSRQPRRMQTLPR